MKREQTIRSPGTTLGCLVAGRKWPVQSGKQGCKPYCPQGDRRGYRLTKIFRPLSNVENNHSSERWPRVLEVLTAKADNLSLSHSTHMVERENQLLQVVLWLPHAYNGMYTHTMVCTYKHTHLHTMVYTNDRSIYHSKRPRHNSLCTMQ